MSGGTFDYIHHKLDEIPNYIEDVMSQGGDSYDFESEDTYTNIKLVSDVTMTAGKMLRTLDWFFAGDIGEETFNKQMSDIFDEIRQ